MPRNHCLFSIKGQSELFGCRGTIVYALCKVNHWMGVEEPLFMLYTRSVRVDGCRGTIVYALYKVGQSGWVPRNHFLRSIQGQSEWMGAEEPLFMLYTRSVRVVECRGTIVYALCKVSQSGWVPRTIFYALYKVRRSGWVLGNHWLCYI